MLEFEEYKGKLNAARPTLEVLRGALKLEAAQKEIEELEAASEREGFWNDVANSQRVQKRLKRPSRFGSIRLTPFRIHSPPIIPEDGGNRGFRRR